jgi:hypothetical protein
VARPELDEIRIADPPDAWRSLGFVVDGDVAAVGGVRIRLGAAGRGIVGWSLRGLPDGADLDGLPTGASHAPPPAEPATGHPIGATAVDHVVALTPDFDRSVDALRRAGLDYRHTREAGRAMRQAFFVLGPCLLELGGPVPDGETRFWGMTLVVADIDAAADQLGSRLGRIKEAVQPGRRIATLQPEAGLGVPLALMTPRS